jgi:hypothetical protein
MADRKSEDSIRAVTAENLTAQGSGRAKAVRAGMNLRRET